VASMAFAVLLGLTIGITASINRKSFFDVFTMLGSILGFSIPPFWLGLLLILLFNVHLNWLPSGGGDTWRHMILPVIALGTASTALIARMTRSAMLEVLNADYIRTARAKGLAQHRIVIRHALRNALIPVVTIVGLQFGILMAGAVITEVVFTWPGIGRLMVESILNRDFPIVRATLLVTSATFIVINLLVDILYASLDPRIKY
jgi:peptide/nickel transport system permease protein